jgi:hypothetical protein
MGQAATPVAAMRKVRPFAVAVDGVSVDQDQDVVSTIGATTPWRTWVPMCRRPRWPRSAQKGLSPPVWPSGSRSRPRPARG